MIKQEEVYRIGRLGKAHGVKGEVSFQFDDDIFDQIDADYLVLDIEGILVPFSFLYLSLWKNTGSATTVYVWSSSAISTPSSRHPN